MTFKFGQVGQNPTAPVSAFPSKHMVADRNCAFKFTFTADAQLIPNDLDMPNLPTFDVAFQNADLPNGFDIILGTPFFPTLLRQFRSDKSRKSVDWDCSNSIY